MEGKPKSASSSPASGVISKKMEGKPASASSSSVSGMMSKKDGEGKGGLPSPREMISLYESKGMDSQEASLKVIEDLQKALFRRLVFEHSNNKKKGSRGDITTSSSQKLDVINSRLINLDMKMDSKPGYPQTLAIGVASGTLLHGIGTVIPHLVSSVAHVWNSVRTSINPER